MAGRSRGALHSARTARRSRCSATRARVPSIRRRGCSGGHRAGVRAAAAFLVEELARCPPDVDGGAVKLEQVVNRRLAELSRRRRDACSRSSPSAGGRLPLSVVAEASGIQGPLGEAIAAARAHRFVRTGLRDGHEVIETNRWRIRDSIVARLSVATVRDHHRRLAVALSAQDVDSEAIALHYLGAGDVARGALCTLGEPPGEAASKLAFAQAASASSIAWRSTTFRMVLPKGGTSYVRLGEVLANGPVAARKAPRARTCRPADLAGSAASRVRLERAAAEQLLASGRIDEGAEVLKGVSWSRPVSARRAVPSARSSNCCSRIACSELSSD